MSLVPVDTVTGEIVEVSPEERTAVARLTTAIAALTDAVDFMPIDDIVSIKAQVVTIQTATRELDMSKEAQELAAEAVRRGEWQVGRAIRRGQAEGAIAKDGERLNRGLPNEKTSAATYFSGGGEYTDVLAMATVAPEAFEQVINDAKAEGNLSRANVVRKIKKQAGPATRDQRADLIADLAAQGYSSRQMPERVGVTEEAVRRIARDYDIEIPADKVVGRTRRLDHTHMVESTVTDLVNTAEFIEAQIDLNEVDFAEADEWLSSLTTSIRILNRFKQQIKENSHV